jgi:hypothetical protein
MDNQQQQWLCGDDKKRHVTTLVWRIHPITFLMMPFSAELTQDLNPLS